MENFLQNPIALRVQGGTLNSDVNLCPSCRYNTTRQSAISGKQVSVCEVTYNSPFLLTEPIGRCNRYLDRNRLTLNEMTEIAWVMDQRRGDKKIGFDWLTPEEQQRRRNGQVPSTTGF